MTIDVDVSGPLFRDDFFLRMDEGIEDLVYQTSSQALAEVHEILNQDIRNPTPYYETQVTQQPLGPLTRIVHDRGIVYGPWLEGVSERNRTTRFKGYFAFRRATQRIEAEFHSRMQGFINNFIAELQ